jgi:hypothetical protein
MAMPRGLGLVLGNAMVLITVSVAVLITETVSDEKLET